MDRNRIAQELQARYRSAAAAGYDIHVAFAVGDDQPLVCRMTGQGIEFDAALTPEVTFYFDSEDTLLSLLGEGGDFTSAFMRGAFRSDGHITLIFMLLMVFQGTAASPDIE